MLVFSEWIGTFPPVTLLSLLLLWSIHVFRLITGYISAADFSLTSPLDMYQLYRLQTGPLLHANGFHICMNSLALASIGPKLESQFGSFSFFVLELFCTLSSSAVYVCLLVMIRQVVDAKDWTYQSTVGFSGCLFSLFVIEAELQPIDAEPLVLFRGKIRIPRRLVPWLSLFFIQVIMPNVSFLGHVSGALVGFGLCRGLGSLLFSCCCSFARYDHSLLARVLSRLSNGNFRNAPAGTTSLPFDRTVSNPLCCNVFDRTILPSTTNQASPSVSSFPTTGGHRLGTV